MIGKVAAGVMVGVIFSVAGTSVAVASVPAPAGAGRAVVERVVDGDTVDVRLDGVMRRIRLLNINTPETVDPDKPVECLGPEASAFLKSLLPAGIEGTLAYDQERIDRYDRTLAALYTPSGTLVNAEIARQGLGAALVVGGNDRFYPAVARARDEAVAAHRGLYATDVACTVPAQVQALATAAAPADDPQASSAQLDAGADAAARAVAATVALQRAFETSAQPVAWSALPTAEQLRLVALVAAVHEKAQRAEGVARGAATAAREREAARDRAAQQERERQEAEERRSREARERAAQEKRERQAADRAEKERRQREARKPTAPAPEPKPSPSVPGGGPWYPKNGGPPGYTGKRCFAPGGTMWRPC